MSQESAGVISVSTDPAKAWGEKAFNVALTCPHGQTSWLVAGDPPTLMAKAQELAGNHRAHTSCSCEAPAA